MAMAPATEVQCRYCLENSDSSKVAFISDDNQIYEKIVKETFNIQILNIKSLNKLCLECAEKLRDAAEIKKKIMLAQEALLEKSGKLFDTDCVLGKQELENKYPMDEMLTDALTDCDEIVDKDDSFIKAESEDIALSDINNDCEDEMICMKVVEAKTEPLGDSNKISRKIRCKRKYSGNVPKNINNESHQQKTTVKKIRTSKKDKSPAPHKERNDDMKNINEITTSNTKSNKITIQSFDREGHIRKNTLALLTNSNMCPFKSKRPKYGCFVCQDTFLNINDLRKHTEKHDIKQTLQRSIPRNRGLSFIYVDISSLTCRICSQNLTEIDDLKEHLSVHGVILENTGHLLVSFRLEDGFRCVICREEFQSFSRLNMHMNSHSTSNVCEKCGLAYTNRMSLRNHIKSLHSRVKCTRCDAIFPTNHARARHMRSVHKIGSYKRYCTKCEMTFTYTHQLYAHRIEKHGEQQQTVTCEHCGKKFNNSLGLRIHIRSVHIGERNYPCSKCEKRFFSKTDKNRHEKTHGSDKPFSCHLCEVRFRSKDSYRRHLKRQHKIT